MKHEGIELRNGYWIERSRIETDHQLLWWIHHLSPKNWFDSDMLLRLLSEHKKLTNRANYPSPN